jgi:hypothetical protein
MPRASRKKLQAGLVAFATWNLQHLSLLKSDMVLILIAAVISLFDVVALQEVNDVRALDKLLQVLGKKDWGYYVSPEVGDGSYKERYAVFYRKSVLEPCWVAVVGQESRLRCPPMLTVFKQTTGGGLFALVRDPPARLPACPPFSPSLPPSPPPPARGRPVVTFVCTAV